MSDNNNNNQNDRKEQRRQKFINKNSGDKKSQSEEDIKISKKLSKEFKHKKQILDEEEWEDWDRYYNK